MALRWALWAIYCPYPPTLGTTTTNYEEIQMSFKISKKYESLPTDAAREAVAIMAKDRNTYAGEFAFHADNLRKGRATLQGFGGVFSQYVRDNGELPINWLLEGALNELSTTLCYNGLDIPMSWITFQDNEMFAEGSTDYLHDFDVVIDAYEKAAAFILSIAGCSQEERLEKLAKLGQSEPFIGIEPNPNPEESDFDSGESFEDILKSWESDYVDPGIKAFLGWILYELGEIVSHHVEGSPLAPGYALGYDSKDVARVVCGILDKEEELADALWRSLEEGSPLRSPEYPKPRDLTPEEWSQLRKSGSSETDDSGFYNDDIPF